MSVQIGISGLVDGAPGRGIEFIQDVARTVEETGLAAFRTPDHVALFSSVESAYPYSETGTAPLRERQGFLAPLMILQAAASVTSRIRLGTAVEVVPLREPIARAKEIATLDLLTGGRLDYGVGVGWMREEYDACGIDFDSRGRRADEFIEACTALWREEASSYAGEFFEFKDVVAYPKPPQSPRPPVLVGGNTPAALRRAARLGDGWYGWNLAVPELDACLVELDRQLDSVGRVREGFRVLVGIPQPTEGPAGLAPYLEALAEYDVEEMVIGLGLSRQGFAAQIEACAALLDP